MDLIQVVTTTDSREAANSIAMAAVRTRLAACAQVSGPIHSTYWWQGEVTVAEEWICTLKTRKDLFDDLEVAILEVHTYEVPEIIAVPIDRGSAGYLDWIHANLRPAAREEAR